MNEEKPKRKYTKRKVKKVDEVIKQSETLLLPGYKNIGLYIYTELTDIDTLKYILSLQRVSDSANIGSQVTIVSIDHVENVGIRNMYVTSEKPQNWTSLSLYDDVICLFIKERPRISPSELVKVLKIGYSDPFVTCLEKT